jgi:hypothetical protein
MPGKRLQMGHRDPFGHIFPKFPPQYSRMRPCSLRFVNRTTVYPRVALLVAPTDSSTQSALPRELAVCPVLWHSVLYMLGRHFMALSLVLNGAIP